MAKKKTRKPTSRSIARAKARTPRSGVPARLLGDLHKLIEQSRQQVAQTVNAALVWLSWSMGKRIREDLLKEDRADYGAQIVATLSRQLTPEFGRGYSEKSLWRMVQFAERFPDEQIVAALLCPAQINRRVFALADLGRRNSATNAEPKSQTPFRSEAALYKGI